MKTNIRYSILNLLFFGIGLTMTLVGLVVVLSNAHENRKIWWGIICLAVLAVIFIISLLVYINNVQWFDIKDGYISVRSPYGLIKRAELAEIKKAFKDNASVFQLKGTSVRRMHIVLCLRKSLTKASIVDAYNKKSHKYVIIPYTEENEALIRSEYNKVCGEELVIK